MSVMLFGRQSLRTTLLVFGMLASTWSAAAQTRAPKAGDGQERLSPEREFAKDVERQFTALRRGEEAVSDANKGILDLAAQHFAYRFTQSDFQMPKASGKGMQDIRSEAFQQIVNLRDTRSVPNANQIAFMDEFGKRFVARLREVAKNPIPIARVNAAMTLAVAAARGTEEAVDVLVEILDDPKENDAVKLWAAKGLGEFFAGLRGPNAGTLKNKEREARCVAALQNFVTRKVDLPADTDPTELAALSIIRSAAVVALGNTRYPAYAKTVDKKRVLDKPTALILLKVARKDGVIPEPRIGEQVVAAVGVCQLEPKLLDEYQSDYAIFQVGKFLGDFSKAYNDRKLGEKEQKGEPWKINAARLLTALTDLKNESAGTAAGDYIGKLTDQATPLLTEIMEGKTENSDPLRLLAWLEANPPKNTFLFKDQPNSQVGGGAAPNN